MGQIRHCLRVIISALAVLKNTQTSELEEDSVSGGFGLSASGEGVGVYVEAGFSQNDLDEEGTQQVNASIHSQGNLTLVSGNDTEIAGANLSGSNTHLDVGGDLTVASTQDTGTVEGESVHANVRGTFGSGVSVSGSVGGGTTDGETLWTSEQTSIVGTNSVNIDVANHTQVDGALIANIGEDGTDGGNPDVNHRNFGYYRFYQRS